MVRLKSLGRYSSSVNNTFVVNSIPAPPNAYDPLIYYQSISPEIASTLENGLQLHSNLRWELRAVVTFERTVDGELSNTDFEFGGGDQILLRPDEIGGQIENAWNLRAILL